MRFFLVREPFWKSFSYYVIKIGPNLFHLSAVGTNRPFNTFPAMASHKTQQHKTPTIPNNSFLVCRLWHTPFPVLSVFNHITSSLPNKMSLLNGFLGGTLVGSAAALTLLGAGEIMGMSGIIGPLLKNPWVAIQDPSQQWKFAFLSTFLLSAHVFFLPTADTEMIASVAAVTSRWAYLLSGLLIGFGTKLGNGCTTGHGICGLARFSKRSLASVLTFMGAAVASTMITSPHNSVTGRYFEFLRSGASMDKVPYVMPAITAALVGLTLYGILLHSPHHWKNNSSSSAQALKPTTAQVHHARKEDQTEAAGKRLPAAMAGVIASAGLSTSTMVYPAAVRSFLDLGGIAQGTWNPTLMFVMMGGLLTSFTAYQLVPGHAMITSCPKLSKPMSASKFSVPNNQVIDAKLLVGALCFGAGWGLTGVCPGPALLYSMTGLSGMILQWWPAFFVGGRAGEWVKEFL